MSPMTTEPAETRTIEWSMLVSPELRKGMKTHPLAGSRYAGKHREKSRSSSRLFPCCRRWHQLESRTVCASKQTSIFASVRLGHAAIRPRTTQEEES